MNDEARSTDAQAMPPPPYRTAAWYDPAREHQPCECPRCRAAPTAIKRQRAGPRVALVLLGGVVLPLVSLGLNTAMHVVELGVLGTTLLLLAVASTIAHLVWSRREVDLETGRLVHRPPASTAGRLLLLAGAALSCLTWGYLALFFLPLLPISVLLVVYLGLGLCGLCPFIALAVGVIQLVRAFGPVRRRLSLGSAIAALLVPLVAPPLLAGAFTAYEHTQRQRLVASVDRVAALPALSTARASAIVALAGEERRLIDLYVVDDDGTRRSTIAQIYHRLTDTVLDRAAVRRGRPERRRDAMLRPFAFIDGLPLVARHNWWVPRGL